MTINLDELDKILEKNNVLKDYKLKCIGDPLHGGHKITSIVLKGEKNTKFELYISWHTEIFIERFEGYASLAKLAEILLELDKELKQLNL